MTRTAVALWPTRGERETPRGRLVNRGGIGMAHADEAWAAAACRADRGGSNITSRSRGDRRAAHPALNSSRQMEKCWRYGRSSSSRVVAAAA
jgi:hypothetical protein